MVWMILIMVLIAADQASKIIIRNVIEYAQAIPVIDDFFYITHRINKGAAWSFLAGKEWGIYLLAAISAIASVFMIYLIIKSKNKKFKLVVSIICAGSIGNLIDRVLFRGVTDFLDFHFGDYIFPTFNIADSLIVCGSILLFIITLTDKHFMEDVINADNREKVGQGEQKYKS